jgi:hypothetical protein
MSRRTRIGNFFFFCGLMGLVIFFASLYMPQKQYQYAAFFIGVALCTLGWITRSGAKTAPAAPKPKPAAPPPAAPKPPAAQKQGLLSTLLKGPQKLTPPKPPPPPPPPPKKKGLLDNLLGKK